MIILFHTCRVSAELPFLVAGGFSSRLVAQNPEEQKKNMIWRDSLALAVRRTRKEPLSKTLALVWMHALVISSVW